MSREENGRTCGYNKFKRPRYFHGMLLDEKDFQAAQGYHIGKRRLLNRMLHGWGVVCGLGLEWKEGKTWVRVTPGLALDCCGNDIWVYEPFTVDLTAILGKKAGEAGKCGTSSAADGSKEYHLCIHYKESATDPVPVYVPGADCKEQECDFSRFTEGFCVQLLDSYSCPSPEIDGLLPKFCECDCDGDEGTEEPVAGCPEVDCDGLDGKALCKCRALAEFCSKSVPCPACPECVCPEHCIVLGKIRVDAEGCLESVCINDCRKYVLTGHMLQYLVASVFSGAEGWFQVERPDGTCEDLPDATRILENPIEALCWLLRRLLVEQGELKKTEEGQRCLGDDDAPTPMYASLRGAAMQQRNLQRTIERGLKDVGKGQERVHAGLVELENRTVPLKVFEAKIAEYDQQIAELKEMYAAAQPAKKATRKRTRRKPPPEKS